MLTSTVITTDRIKIKIFDTALMAEFIVLCLLVLWNLGYGLGCVCLNWVVPCV